MEKQQDLVEVLDRNQFLTTLMVQKDSAEGDGAIIIMGKIIEAKRSLTTAELDLHSKISESERLADELTRLKESA
eukprot:SAG31_NODE_39158_length_290_cov_1.083770_1_plen_74_part_10